MLVMRRLSSTFVALILVSMIACRERKAPPIVSPLDTGPKHARVESPPSRPTGQAHVWATGATLYAQASTTSPSIGRLIIGKPAATFDVAGAFTKVEVQGRRGFVLTSALGSEPPTAAAMIARHNAVPKTDVAARFLWSERAAALDPFSIDVHEKLLQALLDERPVNERRASAVRLHLVQLKKNAKKP